MAIGRISGQMLKANLLRSGVDLAFETNLLVLDVTNSFVGIGTSTPSRQLHLSGTGALRLPSGTTGQRGTSANGDIRYNSTLNTIEGYSNSEWKNLADQGIDDIVEDTTPQLGGNLDVNGFSIVSTANADISITPNGTGSVAMTKVNIDGGAIDGTTIGASSAAAGTFTTLNANTVDINGGAIDGTIIGGSVAAAGTFTTVDTSGNVTVGGNLTVNGTTTTIESTTLTIEDPLIILAKNNSGGAGNTYDQGLLFNRGSLSNVSFIWDESADEFAFANTAAETGTTAGNVTIDSYSNIRAGIISASTSLNTGAIKALDGTASITIANSTGAVTANNFSSSGVTITGGTINGTTIGASSRSTGQFTSIDANAGIDIDADNQSLRIGAGNDFTVAHDGTNTQVTNTTGILKIDGAATSSIRINEAGANVDVVIEGDSDADLFYVDASADKIGISTSTPAYSLDISTTDALQLPQGSTAERPTCNTGVIRYNTTLSTYEGSTDGSTWASFALGGSNVSINKVSATGDGSTSTFSGFFSAAPAGANNVQVYIDNVYQEPTENYTVSGTGITFGSAPHSGARIFAIEGFDNTAVQAGGVARSLTSSVNFTSSATTIMDFNATTYRSAELYVQVTDSANGEYSVMKAHVIHDGSSAYINTYGVVNTGSSDTAELTATYSGGTVSVQATSTGGQSSAIVQYSLAAA